MDRIDAAALRITVTTAPHELLVAARLLADFNREYGDPAPDPEWLADHLGTLVAGGDTVVLTVAEPLGGVIVGVAVLRLRTMVWAAGTEAYLAELYVAPAFRGRGIGTAFLDANIEHARERGAVYIDLNTSEDDLAARHVYEKRGFDCHEGRGSGPLAVYYELELDPAPTA
jgi:ribosomal protein S18 acetylase RimI-like enzyme